MRFEAGEGKYRICAELSRIGEDLLVVISGGERPHIGACAFSYPEASENERSSEEPLPVTEAFQAPGHKELIIAKAFSEDICRMTGKNVLVSCGIHVDNADAREIELLCSESTELRKTVLEYLEKNLTTVLK